MAKQHMEMEVGKVVMELPDTKTLSLRWPENYEIDFKTGQFIAMAFPDKPKYRRAYSLSSCALDRGFFDVTIKRDGKMGTRVVDWTEEGDIIHVLPPVGKFQPVYEPDKHLICIAGGSGVTPYRAFAREATRRGLDTKITVLYSVKTTKDIIFDEEFRELEKQNPHFDFKVTCTRLADDDPWTGRRGRIDTDWVKEQIGDLTNTVFYACGPTGLVEGTETLVKGELGVPKAQMKLEKWG
jgi:ferredoxin-NADP reductase